MKVDRIRQMKSPADITLLEYIKVLEDRSKELSAAIAEKLKIANEFIAKYNARFRAFEDMDECADLEDGNGWDDAFHELEEQCVARGIVPLHPESTIAKTIVALQEERDRWKRRAEEAQQTKRESAP